MQPAEAETAREQFRVRSASAVSLVPSEYSAFADVSHGRSSASSFSSLPDQLCASLPVQNLQAAVTSPQYSHCRTPQQISSVLAAESDSLLDTRRRKFQQQLPKQHRSHYHPPAGTLMGLDLHRTSSPFKPVTTKMLSSQQATSESREGVLVSGDHLHNTTSHTPVSVNRSPISASPLQMSQSFTVPFRLNSCSPVNTSTLLVADTAICPVSPSVFDIFTMLIRAAHFLSSVQNSVAPQSPLASCANPRNGEL